ncbi:MAG: threonine/serine exporter family protein [Leptolyngbya sp. IPPAS B-1204]|uniref:Threonine/serine exporter n=1 Tax=Leptolyngbya sp. NK1-12 TaxID=2547451 RepID=A0AA97AJC3_9CYAN|nr:threonine/serine exporter family protein [Leptolyngbya sp. NK1-12]MBF2046708.1 threonine/serine exporter family protein [Elainella sp. C42_A2020_010]RNJ66101.1 MAG: threonine/serine exporter [Leptolyngbya sp. IPPAS B-1204]WNZ22622.1 threonine/serine exporter [Leptolyngbya sp. NK1-12]
MLSATALLQDALLSFIGTFGFALLYQVPRKALWLCAAIGMGGYVLRSLLHQLGLDLDIATFCGALFVGLVGTIPAQRLQLPLVLFAITGIICMVPGIPAFKVLVYFEHGDILGGLGSAIEAGFAVVALVSGIGAARILTDSEWGFE